MSVNTVWTAGVTNVNCVTMAYSGSTTTNAALIPVASEIIVADEDTRSVPGLATLAPVALGTNTAWSNNAAANLNEITISDAQPVYSNTNAQLQDYTITALPTGTFVIKAVKISARIAKSQSPGVTRVELGYDSGGTTGYGTGAIKSPTNAYATYEQLDATNPITTVAWVQSDLTSLQLDMQALT